MKIKTGIPDKERKTIAEGLSRVLADTYTLYLKTHGFHWNVTGPMFQTLHTMFEQQYTELWTATDLIAERIRALAAGRQAATPTSRSAAPSRRSAASPPPRRC
jgi:starvation-inducible DNA-binding protein